MQTRMPLDQLKETVSKAPSDISAKVPRVCREARVEGGRLEMVPSGMRLPNRRTEERDGICLRSETVVVLDATEDGEGHESARARRGLP